MRTKMRDKPPALALLVSCSVSSPSKVTPVNSSDVFILHICPHYAFRLKYLDKRDINFYHTGRRRFHPVAALEIQSAAERGRDLAKRIKHPLIIAMLKRFIES